MDYLGIDVSKDRVDVYLLAESGARAAEFGNHKKGWHSRVNWLKQHSPAGKVHVCLEATGRYGSCSP